MLHAYTGCHPPRTHPADASAVWRPSPHTALEPQPDPGALAGAAAGPAGRAIETPYAATAALSNASGIGPVSSCKLPGKSSRVALNLFPSRQDKILPGTLHHSGNRPAPPSDHTPLARRSAFQAGAGGEFGRAFGLNRMYREDFCRADAANVFTSRWNMELCGSAPVIAKECGRSP